MDLLLGAASMALLRRSDATLAGRATDLELWPVTVREAAFDQLDALWPPSGVPDSPPARDGPSSLRWRKDFIRSDLGRDVPQFGRRTATQTLRRFCTMLAYHQRGLLNAASLSGSLGVDG